MTTATKNDVYFTIQQIKDANKAIGNHWFDADTMRFFKCRVSGPVIANMFISSERFSDDTERRYTIRRCTNGEISDVGEFQQYRTKAQALAALRKIAQQS